MEQNPTELVLHCGGMAPGDTGAKGQVSSHRPELPG